MCSLVRVAVSVGDQAASRSYKDTVTGSLQSKSTQHSSASDPWVYFSHVAVGAKYLAQFRLRVLPQNDTASHILRTRMAERLCPLSIRARFLTSSEQNKQKENTNNTTNNIHAPGESTADAGAIESGSKAERRVRTAGTRKEDNVSLKKLKCDTCGSMFRHGGHLVEHYNSVHMGLRRFKCQHCGKCFSTSGNRAAHVRHQHERADFRPHACPKCSSSFKVKSKL
eukprot:CAMPEP_0185850088 /NCGR_PEP_ID=MMETSP1354-20130828/4357_1 /TAXON_ID=708628 /ORGANISM="Erythrolobus madagascarensis, Strain CCMP3276" /LENGTH=224 /DNA_ID=CAMNT_0028550723 /DNA_START=53 /DNA_END=724 /DNA_ORIENTATION=-